MKGWPRCPYSCTYRVVQKGKAPVTQASGAAKVLCRKSDDYVDGCARRERREAALAAGTSLGSAAPGNSSP